MKTAIHHRFLNTPLAPKRITHPTGDTNIKYEYTAARHMIYVEMSGQVRWLEFPDEITAHNFARSMKVYLKLKG